MHRTLTLKISFNRLSDGTSETLVINKVHQLLEQEFCGHGFTGVQKIAAVEPEPDLSAVPVETEPKPEPAIAETAEEPAKRKPRKTEA